MEVLQNLGSLEHNPLRGLDFFGGFAIALGQLACVRGPSRFGLGVGFAALAAALSPATTAFGSGLWIRALES